MFRVHLATLVADRTPKPDFLGNMSGEPLEDLSWTDPSLGVSEYGWWLEEDQSPQLELYQHYGDESLTVDAARRRVVVVRAIVPWSQEEIDAYKAPIQDAVWEQIKGERDGAKIVGGRSDGGVLVGGHWFHSDLISRVKWLALAADARDQLAAGGAPADLVLVLDDDDPTDDGTVLWKTMAGGWIPVTVQLALDVVAGVKRLDKRLFKVAEQHRIALLGAHDPAVYDYTAGWPTRYVDTLTDAAEQLQEKIA